MILDILHCYSLIRTKIHQANASRSQLPPQHFVLSANSQTLFLGGVVQYASIDSLKGVGAFDDLKFGSIVMNKLKLFSKHL